MEIKYRALRFPEGKSKAVTLSYDDGKLYDMRLSDIISEHGLKCTFNLTGSIGCEGVLSKEQVKEYILDRGHEVAVHGNFHKAPGRHRAIEGIRDTLECRLALEEKFDMIIRGMAYPDTGISSISPCTSYETIREYLKNLDIVYSRALGGDNDRFELPNDWLAWMPTAHHENPELFSYIDKFLNINLSEQYIARREPKLFYLWGHSFEFEINGNWDLLERVSEKLAGHKDIWYATNIEIYNYVEAYNSLVYSADSTRVYNPTLYTIWFEIFEKIYCVKPGETIKID